MRKKAWEGTLMDQIKTHVGGVGGFCILTGEWEFPGKVEERGY